MEKSRLFYYLTLDPFNSNDPFKSDPFKSDPFAGDPFQVIREFVSHF